MAKRTSLFLQLGTVSVVKVPSVGALVKTRHADIWQHISCVHEGLCASSGAFFLEEYVELRKPVQGAAPRF